MRRLLSTGVTIAGLLTMSPAHGAVAMFYDRIGGPVGWADKPWELANGGRIPGCTADGRIYGGRIGFTWQTGE